MSINLTEMQKSALLEAGNVGSGHAATALSKIMNRKIMISVPSVEFIDISRLDTIIIGGDKVFIMISFAVKGDFQGAMIFVMGREMALSLYDIFSGNEKGTTKVIGDFEQSAIIETANIISASYINALCRMTRMSSMLFPSKCFIGSLKLLNPEFFNDIFDIRDIKEIFCVKTEFISDSSDVYGYILYAPAEGAIEKIIGHLSGKGSMR